MRILFKAPQKEPEEREIENKLDVLQELIGGYIECHAFNRHNNIVMICDEEGRLKHLAPNFMTLLYGMIYGNVIFVCADDKGEFTSLDLKAIEIVKWFLESGD